MNEDQIEMLTDAIRLIAHGNQNGPAGLEMLSIAIAGEGVIGHDSLAEAIHGLSRAISEGFTELSHAVVQLKQQS